MITVEDLIACGFRIHPNGEEAEYHEWVVHPDDGEDAARKIANWIRLYCHTGEAGVRRIEMREPRRCWLDIETRGSSLVRLETAPTTELGREALLRLGWEPPSEGGRGRGRYWQEWSPTDPVKAAAVAATTLFVVHHYDEAKGWGGGSRA